MRYLHICSLQPTLKVKTLTFPKCCIYDFLKFLKKEAISFLKSVHMFVVISETKCFLLYRTKFLKRLNYIRVRYVYITRRITFVLKVELRLSGHWLSGSLIIWIGLALHVNLSRSLQK